jgi:hypothetical protein
MEADGVLGKGLNTIALMELLWTAYNFCTVLTEVHRLH